ncbi:Putative AMP-dependent synthetase/ligase, Condensation domain, phosphopantetheine binding ACP [Septoria linicola]|uniref:AMP-dependent synthetase/ligase, Condensation domain, phosphopantetheine binding ACP n=1 Tax=Septoria linicola TaxID=215465 RepID=A0A9Q9AXM0_9PEZI|nr:Putative AMP-dependent synthetase/ligase, Condensation domain, phosphopantetheine binding ACP [Septoria linicola]
MPAISSSDLKQIWQWNATVPETLDGLVHDLILETARRQPSAPAIEAWNGSFTYEEIDRYSRQWAIHLKSLGVGPEVHVSLLSEKSKWVPVAMLGVMRSGGVTVVMDITQPEERLGLMMDQVRPSVVLASDEAWSTAERLAKNAIICSIDADELSMNTKSVRVPHSEAPAASGSNALWVSFTSGSTGRPKAVVVEHRNLYTELHLQAEPTGLSTSSRVFDYAGYSWDMTWYNVLFCWHAGGCLCIPSERDRRQDPSAAIKRFRANFANITPTVADLLDDEALHMLKGFETIGERASPKLLSRIHSSQRYRNTYGASECGSLQTAALNPESPDNIGYGSGVITWLVNEDEDGTFTLAPIGESGEIWLEGPLVSRGYLRDEAQTAKAFVEDPAFLLAGDGDSVAGRRGRLYRMGDLAKYAPDGSMRIQGRRDWQVKLRGQRVELGEVEHHVRGVLSEICGESGLQVAAMAAIPREHEVPTLVVYVVTPHAADLDDAGLCTELCRVTEGIDEKLRARVPPYMIPKGYIPLRQMPLTYTGKRNRAVLTQRITEMTLREIAVLWSSDQAVRQDPSTESEKLLQLLIAEILDLNPDDISAEDNFLRMGGDSVLGIRLTAAARAKGTALSVAEIFAHPRICDLAAHIDESNHDTTGKAQDSFASGPVKPFDLLRKVSEQAARSEAAEKCFVAAEQIEDVFGCTALQAGLIALTAQRADDYVGRQKYRLLPGIDLDRFKAAWELVVATLPILRTRMIDLEQEGLVQVVIAKSLPVEWESGVSGMQHTMGLGSSLARFAIITEHDTRYFQWTMHHALFDGMSLPLILTRLRSAYHLSDPGAAPPLFQEFVRHVQSIDNEGSTAAWRAHLDDLDAEVFPSLPSIAYKPHADHEIVHHMHDITWPITAGVTAASVIRAALALLLADYTGSSDVVFGVTTSGRAVPVAGVESMVAPTLATAPARTKVDFRAGELAGNLLARVQHDSIALSEAEQLGLQAIRRVSPDAERACQFQTLLLVEPAEENIESDRLFESEAYEESLDTTVFNSYALLIHCYLLRDGGLRLTLSFDSALLCADQAKRLGPQLEHIVRQLCSPQNHQVPVSALSLTCPGDLNDIWSWNASIPTSDIDEKTTVHDLFRQRVRLQPDATAITSWDGKLTYRELDELSDSWAQRLSLQHAVGPEVVVPLCLEKGIWMTVAVMAVMKAGGVCCALDVGQPTERLESIVEQVAAPVILATKLTLSLALSLCDSRCKLGLLDDENSSSAAASGTAAPRVRSANALYVSFTSGSTGVPKGCIVEHRNFLHAIKHQRSFLNIDASSRILDFASPAFDVFWENMLMGLTAGATLCTPSREERMNDLDNFARQNRITYAEITPAHVRVVDFSHVATLNLSGEALKYADIEYLEHSKTRVLNSYGPAECTVTATASEVARPFVGKSGSPDLGQGLGAATWVLSVHQPGKLAAVGAVGELCLEGDLVGRGYLNNVSATKASFGKDPKWLANGSGDYNGRSGRLYRTGDLVRYSSDGTLHFLGRRDDMVKIRGQRVELGDVEMSVKRVLSDQQSESNAQIQVVAEIIDKNLIAFIVQPSATTQRLMQSDRLSDLVAEQVPEYMVPTAFLALDELPLSSSNKVDRRKLREQATASLASLNAQSTSKTAVTAPSNEDEYKLRDIWAEVLGLDKDTISNDIAFTRLGGDSISAMQVVSRARSRGLMISIVDLLRSRTIKRTVGTLDTDQSLQVGPGAPKEAAWQPSSEDELCLRSNGLRNKDVLAMYGCSPMQEGMLFSKKTGIASYTTHSIWACESVSSQPVSTEMLESAWRAVLTHHSIFSTIFLDNAETGGFMQAVRMPTSFEHKIAIESSGETDSAQWLKGQRVPPRFQPGEPEVAVTIAIDDRGAHACRLDTNHALIDAASVSVILEHLDLAYRDVSLPEAPPFREVIRYIERSKTNDRLEYWTTFLSSVQPCHFPAQVVERAATSTKTRTLTVQDGHDTTIYDFCQARDITRATFVQVVWALVLTHYTGVDEACFGFLASGRDMPIADVDQAVGPLINMLVSRITSGTTVEHMLRTAAQDTITHLGNQHVSLAEIQRNLGKSKLFNSSITVYDAAVSDGQGSMDTGADRTVSGLRFVEHDAFDEQEFDIGLAMGLRHKFTAIEFGYREGTLSSHAAQEVVKTINLAINYILTDDTRIPSSSGLSFFEYIVGAPQQEVDSFWKAQLTDVEAPVFPTLPSVNHQPLPDAASSKTVTLPTQGLVQTAEMYISAAWALLQAKYTNSDQVLFGLQQQRPEQENLIGRSSTIKHPLPARIILGPSDTTMEAFLSRIQQQTSSMRKYNLTPAQHLKRLTPDADNSFNFQTLVSFVDTHQPGRNSENAANGTNGRLKSNGVTSFQHSARPNGFSQSSTTNGCQTVALTNGSACDRQIEANENSSDQSYPSIALLLECFISAGETNLKTTYDSSIVSTQSVNRMLEQLEHTIHLLASPDLAQTPLQSLDIVSSADLHDIWQWNVDVPEPIMIAVHEIFAETAQARPEAEAVYAWDGNLNYQEIDELSSRLAIHLVSLGVGSRFDAIPLLFEKSVWMPVAMLAASKTGAAAVTMDVSQPVERLATIAAQVQARVIVCSASSVDMATQVLTSGGNDKDDFLVVPIDKERIEGMPLTTQEHVLPKVDPSKPVFIQFTSGSTGVPKGCCISHANLATAIQLQYRAHLEYSPRSRCLDFASYAFDACWATNIGVLCAGGVVCVPSEDQRKNDIVGFMRGARVTNATFTPTLAETINDQALLRSLNYIELGGEAVGEALVQRLLQFTRVRIAYGPSECTIGVAFAKKDEGDRGIGRGIAAGTFVVDPIAHQLVPIGAIGELWISGPLVTKGYLNDSVKTAASFIESPYWFVRGGQSGKLYRTGDLVRYNEDGSIHFVGRLDTQIKHRGQRLELDEVRFHILQKLNYQADEDQEGVQVVADMITAKDRSRASLVGFIIPKDARKMPEQDLSAMAIRMTKSISSRLGTVVPSYMVPAGYIALPSLPTTATGKVDRRRLQEIGRSLSLDQLINGDSSTVVAYREPSTKTELQLRDLIAKTLNVSPDSISADSGFLQLGGDSILSMRLVALARQEGISLSVADVFNQPTLTALALTARYDVHDDEQEIIPFSLLDVETDIVKRQAALLCKISEAQVEDVFPCTSLQAGLLSMTAKHESDYIWQLDLRLHENIDQNRLKQAWEVIVAHAPVIVDETAHWNSPAEARTVMGLGTPLSAVALDFAADGRACFQLSLHHAVYDAHSMQLVIHALQQIYWHDALPGFSPFQPFVQHIQAVLNTEEEAAFWNKQFIDLDAARYPSLPSTGYTPRANSVSRTRVHCLGTPPPGITLATVIRATWSLLLTQLTGRSDTVFGAIVTGRQADVKGIESCVGPTLATVPVRIAPDYKSSLRTFLEQVQRQATDMTTYEQSGLQRIRKMSPEAEEACHFQSLLVYNALPVDFSAKTDGDLFDNTNGPPAESDTTSDEAFTNYALTIVVDQHESKDFELTLSSDNSVVDNAELNSISRQFEHILRLICTKDAGLIQVGQLGLASDHDLAEIWQWNREVPQPVSRCVHDIFAETVRAQPHAEAVNAWNGSLTFEQLDQLSTRLSAHISGLGVIRGTLVPLYFEKSMWMTVAMWAVMKAGGASAGNDVTQPAERLRKIVGQIKPLVVLTSAESAGMAQSLVDVNVQIVIVDAYHLQNMPLIGPVESGVRPCDPLFLVFTSGSTGEPKGVTITHENIASAIHHQADTLEIGRKGARLLDFASYAFDVTWQSNVMAVAQGSCVCVPSDHQRQNDLSNAMAELKVTSATLTPLVAETLDLNVVKGLRYIELGGEMVSDALIQRMPTRVRVTYGPSEATLGVAYAKKDRGDVGIGPPTGVCAWIVDPITSNRLVGKGCLGELWVEGPLVSPGYMNDPEKTAASFVQSPDWLMAGGPGSASGFGRRGRLYKTGDLVRYADNGHLVIVGRKDVQVKIRGQRVELSAIEAIAADAIRSSTDSKATLANISVVADLVTPIDAAGTLLVAFVALEGMNTNGSETILRSAHAKIAASAPSYMVPVAYMILDEMPRTTTGKVDRRKLREYASAVTTDGLFVPDRSSAGEQRAPSTDAEHFLRRMWSSTLKATRTISAKDNFLLLGGDSIEAMKLVSAVRQSGKLLTVADVFKYPVLEDLAKHLRLGQVEEAELPRPFSLLADSPTNVARVRKALATATGLSADDIEDAYPCTALQEGLLALAAQRSGAYFARNVFRLGKTVDLGRFKQAWSLVEGVTPILRTRFVDLHGHGLVQCVVRQSSEWQILGGDEQRPDRLMSVLGVPLSEVALATDKRSGQTAWHWTIHHALYDEPTVNLVLDSLRQAYHNDTAASLTLFSPFIRKVRSVSSETCLEFWQNEFTGLDAQPFPSLPEANYQPKADTAIEHTIKLTHDAPAGITMSTVLRAVWALLTMQYTNTNDAIFGAVVSGRQASLTGLATVAGPTIATVPVRVRMPTEEHDNDITVQTLLQQIQMQAVNMTDYEQTGLQYIQKTSEEAADACRFQSLLVVQPRAGKQQLTTGDIFDDSEFTNEDDSSSAVLEAFTTYAMAVVCQLDEHEVHVTLGIDTGVVSKGKAQRIAHQMEHILQQICLPANSGARMKDIDWVGHHDLRDIWSWNSKISIEPANLPMHQLIEVMVHRHPNSPALCSHDGELDYQQLWDLSTRLAQHLVALGIGAGMIVPILFEKSIWFPIACLAIMQTGAGTCAMDVSQPEERLRTMVRKAGPTKVILASAESANLAGRICSEQHTEVVSINHEKLQDMPRREVALPRVDPESTLYVVFTSGSTGEPKGVVISHSNLASMSTLQSDFLELGPNKRVLDFASYAFDSTWDFNFLTLAAGGCVCIPSEVERRSDISGAIRRMRVTQGTFSPTFAETFSDETVRRLDFIEMGGEAVPQHLIDRFLRITRVRIAYGPSEATIGVMFAKQDLGQRGLGYGVGCRTWIVNPDAGRLAPIGAKGELWLQGPLVGKGYLNDDAQTRKAFIELPDWLHHLSPGHSSNPGDRLYKTGDLVSYNEDGTINFHGRKDGQVKLRGQRLEMADVESNILRQMGEDRRKETQVVVEIISAPWTSDRDTLVAFIKLAGSESIRNSDLTSRVSRVVHDGVHEGLKRTLPLYMIPARYVALPTLPRTTTGKIDRRRLRATEHVQELIIDPTTSNEQRRAPETDMEARLQRLWSTVLAIPQDSISAIDSFIALGGDSVQAMRLANLCHRQGLEMTVMDVFTKPILYQLAEVISTATAAPQALYEPFALLNTGLDLDTLKENAHQQLSAGFEIEDILPLSHAQRESIDGSINGGPTGLHWFTIDLPDTIDGNRLLDSCHLLMKQIDVLRTVFVRHEQQIYQVLLKDLQFPAEIQQVPMGQNIIDWSNMPFVDDENDLSSCFGRSYVRFVLLRDSTGVQRLAIRLWHAQYDGASIPRIAAMLQDIYGGRSLNEEPRICSLIALQKSAKVDTDYWNNVLEGSSMTYMQTRDAPASIEVTITTLKFEETIPFLQHAETSKKTPATIFTAACAVMLAQISNTSDVLFGRLTSGRAALPSHLRNIVCNCLTYLPVRVRLDSGGDLKDQSARKDTLSQVYQQYIDGLASENIRPEHLAEQCENWPAKTPEFGILTLFQNLPTNAQASQDVKLASASNNFEIQGLKAVTDEVYASDTVTIAGIPQHDGTLIVQIMAKSTLFDQQSLDHAGSLLCAALSEFGEFVE